MGFRSQLAQLIAGGAGLKGPSQRPPPVEPEVNVWPDADISALPPDRGRAVVQSVERMPPDDGGRPTIHVGGTYYTWIVRRRLPEGGFGPRERCWAFVPPEVGAPVDRGREIPVIVDPMSGAMDVDIEGLERELKP